VSPVVAARRAGWLLIAAGLLVVLGSFLPWVNCSTVGCDSPLQSLDQLSGVTIGVGWLTAISGVVLIGLGWWAVRGPFDDRGARAAVVTGLLITFAAVVTVVVVVALAVADTELSVRSAPGLGVIVVGVGGAVAAIIGWWLRRVLRESGLPT
jgi:hypothetical protein